MSLRQYLEKIGKRYWNIFLIVDDRYVMNLFKQVEDNKKKPIRIDDDCGGIVTYLVGLQYQHLGNVDHAVDLFKKSSNMGCYFADEEMVYFHSFENKREKDIMRKKKLAFYYAEKAGRKSTYFGNYLQGELNLIVENHKLALNFFSKAALCEEDFDDNFCCIKANKLGEKIRQSI
jgi:hypothetical protein